METSVLIIFLLYIYHASAKEIIPVGYNKAIRPSSSKNDSRLEVSYSILINGVYEINPDTASIKLHMYMRMSWSDERLLFPFHNTTEMQEIFNDTSKSEMQNVTSIILNPQVLDYVWVPDHFFKSAQKATKFKLLQTSRGIKLYNNQRIFASSMDEVQVGCPMNFRAFPFDVQQCVVILSSFFYDTDELIFSWHKMGLAINTAAHDQLGNYRIYVVQSNETICPCDNCEISGEKEPCIKFVVILDRFNLNFILGFYIPAFILNMVAWCSTFCPAEKTSARTTIVGLALVTAINLHGDMKKNSPNTSYVKALDVWLFFCVIMNICVVFQYAVLWTFIRRQTNPFGAVSLKPPHIKKTYSISQNKIYQEMTEDALKYGFPMVYFIFNICYWAYIITF